MQVHRSRQQRRSGAQGAEKERSEREGIFREMKQRSAFEKPSERKVREKAEAVRRARKADAKDGDPGGTDRRSEA